jgi:hypothetical protein
MPDADPIFASAIRNSRDVTDSFYADAGRVGLDVGEQSDRDLIGEIRTLMEEQGIIDIATVVEPEVDQANDLLASGAVAAVDGTHALAVTNLLSTGIYACAVGYLTRLMRGKPEIAITQTNASYVQTNHADSELDRLMDELEDSRQAASWPATFREYREREVAMGAAASHVLLDGPVITQNLITQPAGRALYDAMADSGKQFFGVIKNTSVAHPFTHWAAYALHRGEAYAIPMRDELKRRFSKRGRRDICDWFDRDFTQDYVRIVYRLNVKPFALECEAHNTALGLALVTLDASKTLHHEIPLLLEIIDAQMRNISRAEFFRQKLLSQMGDHEHAIKLADERMFR